MTAQQSSPKLKSKKQQPQTLPSDVNLAAFYRELQELRQRVHAAADKTVSLTSSENPAAPSGSPTKLGPPSCRNTRHRNAL